MSPVPNHTSGNERKHATSKIMGKVEETTIDIPESKTQVHKCQKEHARNNGKPLLLAFGPSMAAKVRNMKRREEEEEKKKRDVEGRVQKQPVRKDKEGRGQEARVQKEPKKGKKLRKKEEEGALGLGRVDYVGE
jgi:hypothetical protein